MRSRFSAERCPSTARGTRGGSDAEARTSSRCERRDRSAAPELYAGGLVKTPSCLSRRFRRRRPRRRAARRDGSPTRRTSCARAETREPPERTSACVKRAKEEGTRKRRLGSKKKKALGARAGVGAGDVRERSPRFECARRRCRCGRAAHESLRDRRCGFERPARGGEVTRRKRKSVRYGVPHSRDHTGARCAAQLLGAKARAAAAILDAILKKSARASSWACATSRRERRPPLRGRGTRRKPRRAQAGAPGGEWAVTNEAFLFHVV